MVNVQEITCGESRKLNTRKYESREFSIYLKANAANEDSQKVVLALQDRIASLLDAKEKEIRAKYPPE